MFKELLNIEPFNVAEDGGTIEFWNIDHRFSITETATGVNVKFEDEPLLQFPSDLEAVKFLEKKLDIPGLVEDYRLLADREEDLDKDEEIV